MMPDEMDIFMKPWLLIDCEYSMTIKTFNLILQDVAKEIDAEESADRQSTNYLEALQLKREDLRATQKVVQTVHDAKWNQFEDSSNIERDAETSSSPFTAEQLCKVAKKSLKKLKDDYDGRERSLESLAENRKNRLSVRAVDSRPRSHSFALPERPKQPVREEKPSMSGPYNKRKSASTGTSSVPLYQTSPASHPRRNASSLSQLFCKEPHGIDETNMPLVKRASCYRCGYSLPCSQVAQLQCAPDHGHCTSCLTYLFNQAMSDATTSRPKCLCGGEIAVGVVEGYVFWKTVYNFKKMYSSKERDLNGKGE